MKLNTRIAKTSSRPLNRTVAKTYAAVAEIANPTMTPMVETNTELKIARRNGPVKRLM